MPMTHEQLSIRKSIELWMYLAETGSTVKKDAYAALEFSHDYLDCPLCEYVDSLKVDKHDSIKCDVCPATGAFLSYVTPESSRDSTCHCERSFRSPWWEWLMSSRENDQEKCKTFAWKMVEMLQSLEK